MRGETLRYNRREELLVARDLVEGTRHGPKSNGYRLVGVWTQREARKDTLALVSGAKGAKRRSYTLLERKTGGVAPRGRIWLHQVRERCQSKAPNKRCYVLSVDELETQLDTHFQPNHGSWADAVRLIWIHRVTARGSRVRAATAYRLRDPAAAELS
jgi:hypothetical protein